MKTILLYTICLAVALTACRRQTQPAGSSDGHHHEDPSHGNGPENNEVVISEQQLQTIGVSFDTLSRRQLQGTIRVNGVLKVPHQYRASATSLLGGIVKQIRVQPGQPVRKGQLIASLENLQFIALQEEYLSLAADIRLAGQEQRRQQQLAAGNASSEKVLQASETALQRLRIRHRSLEQQLQLAGLTPAQLQSGELIREVPVFAPVGGVVSDILVDIGSSLDKNGTVIRILDNSQLHVDFFVYEQDLDKIKTGQLLLFRLTNNPGREYQARVFGIGSSFEDDSKSIAVHAQVLGNKTGLIDGMTVTAQLQTGQAAVSALPVQAVVTEEGREYIFYLKQKREEPHQHSHGEGAHEHGYEYVFTRIPVKVGTTADGYSEISPLQPIPAGAQIATAASFFLQGMINGGAGHDHAH